MCKKLCILLIFSKLKVPKLLMNKYRMHNLYAIFAKLLNRCKQVDDSSFVWLSFYEPVGKIKSCAKTEK